MDITDAHLHSKMRERSEERPVAMNQREGRKRGGGIRDEGWLKDESKRVK